MVYIPSYPQISFLCVFAARSWEDFKFLGNLLYCGDLISLLVKGCYTLFCHKIINDQSCKLRNSCWQDYLHHVCMLTFYTFTWAFSLREFSVCSIFHWNSQKMVYCYLVLTLWKCEYCLIWALSKSILFGSNSLKVSVLCDINSKKTIV